MKNLNYDKVPSAYPEVRPMKELKEKKRKKAEHVCVVDVRRVS